MKVSPPPATVRGEGELEPSTSRSDHPRECAPKPPVTSDYTDQQELLIFVLSLRSKRSISSVIITKVKLLVSKRH